MARSFPCPHCQTLLQPAGEAEFQVQCPTCQAAVSPPWIPTLALDEASVPVASAVEEAMPTMATVGGASTPSAAEPVTLTEADEDNVPTLEEVPAAAAPAPAKPGIDWTAFAPPGAAPVQLSPGWRALPFALNLVSFGSAILLITLLFFLVLAAVAALQGFQRSPDGALQISMGTHHRTMIRADVLIVPGGLTMLAGGLLVVVGKLTCCAVPKESNSRTVAMLSALCLLVALMVELATGTLHLGLMAAWPFMLELRDQHPDEVAGFAAYGMLGGLAFHAVEVVLFLLFVRGIGLFFADKRLPPSVVRYFKFTIFGPIVPAIILGIAYLLVRVGPSALSHRELAIVLPVILAGVPLALFAYIVALGLWYVVLVRVARDLIIRARLGRLS